MQKVGQKRSLLNKLREVTNVSGIASEKFFNPEFQEVMDELRLKTDDPVRAIVSGEKIGEADAPADATSLKDLLKSVKSYINRREYMRAVADLGRFHKKMFEVTKILSGFKGNVDKVHEKFLFGDLDDESKQHLHDLKSRVAIVRRTEYFVKEANILDFFTNYVTERGRALSQWEKRYPKQLGKLKKDTANILGQSERLLGITLSVLKELASARAVRNPDKYISAADKIVKSYDSYDKLFRDYYNSNVKDFLEKQQFVAPIKTDTTNTPQELGKQEVSTTPVALAPTTTPGDPVPEALINTPAPVASTVPESGPVTTPQQFVEPVITTPVDDEAPDTIPNPPPTVNSVDLSKQKLPIVANQHQKFMNSLVILANENPILLVKHISRYASSIQSKDPVTAIKLFKLIKSIENS